MYTRHSTELGNKQKKFQNKFCVWCSSPYKGTVDKNKSTCSRLSFQVGSQPTQRGFLSYNSNWIITWICGGGRGGFFFLKKNAFSEIEKVLCIGKKWYNVLACNPTPTYTMMRYGMCVLPVQEYSSRGKIYIQVSITALTIHCVIVQHFFLSQPANTFFPPWLDLPWDTKTVF